MWPAKNAALAVPSPLEGEGQGGGYASPSEPLASPPSRRAERGDLPLKGGGEESEAPSLTDIIETLSTLGKAQLPAQLARWLDGLDETGRWALLKLVTGGLRIGVSARLAKTAAASLGGKEPNEIEILWPGLAPPYTELFAWLEGRADAPVSRDPAPFRPAMLAHAIEDTDFAALDPKEFMAEWKWDGIRVQAVAGIAEDGHAVTRLYSRTGEDISKSFPDLADALRLPGAIDGELLIVRDGRVQSFNVLQQRLNRKAVTPKLLTEFPAHLRAYDLLMDGDEDIRSLPFAERRELLSAFINRLNDPRVDLSPLVPFDTWEALTAARADPAAAGADADAGAVEGIMLKRRDAAYVPGRPKGLWWKWKRDPLTVDAVLMYAQRGHGKRSSYYSDYTFGVWTKGGNGDELVPVGKAYFGFTDEELHQIDRFIRNNTLERFGPVREVTHEPGKGLVFEVAFEGLQRSTRHKSGLAMRFPRISRLRWDKPPREADRLETLEAMLTRIEAGRSGPSPTGDATKAELVLDSTGSGDSHG
jgi:DNA ligase-1